MDIVTIQNFMQKLGLMGWPLLLTSITAVAILIERLVFVIRNRPRTTQVYACIETHFAPKGKPCSLIEMLTKIRGPLSGLAQTFAQYRDLPDDMREKACLTGMTIWLSRARSPIKTLLTLSQIAPLLGLTGTVLGLVDAFQAIENSTRAVDPSMMAAGIWEALLTTIVGMFIAIPIIVCVRFLQIRIDATVRVARELYAYLEHTLHKHSCADCPKANKEC